jgi:L-alanine-DL-glutamate epimerase-like enolase superfamily enzyme
MHMATDVRVVQARLYFLPVQTRMPLKFGGETLTSVTCARACLTVRDRHGRLAEGWGETPLSVQWVWPSPLDYGARHDALRTLCARLAEAWAGFGAWGHPLEIGADFQEQMLASVLTRVNQDLGQVSDPIPWLAALVCCSVFDQALHDAYGQSVHRPVYETYTRAFLNRDLAAYLAPAQGCTVSFQDRHPADYLLPEPRRQLRAWHLVGGLDPLTTDELTGTEPADGYPVALTDWIQRDGLKCLKIKLRGNDAAWDLNRLVAVGQLAAEHSAEWLSADFNCTVTDPRYVTEILDRLRVDHPHTHARLLYVEQPFPYDLERHRIDVRTVAARKPLFLDESAHDWRLIRLGRELGWTGVALKTCKTQSGAILSACWSRAHGMDIMVQDLTNPMLAQVPHVLLAANVGTIMGVETNAMQFYPAASDPEAQVHPGLYTRRNGEVDLSSIRGPGFGYRLNEMQRKLPEATAAYGEGTD